MAANYKETNFEVSPPYLLSQWKLRLDSSLFRHETAAKYKRNYFENKKAIRTDARRSNNTSNFDREQETSTMVSRNQFTSINEGSSNFTPIKSQQHSRKIKIARPMVKIGG
jgi:hypothetical protein